MIVEFYSYAGSGDIVDKNLKLILGLIWTLILHYQISIGFGIGDDKGQGGPTPKQALISYLQVLTFITLRPTSSSVGVGECCYHLHVWLSCSPLGVHSPSCLVNHNENSLA